MSRQYLCTQGEEEDLIMCHACDLIMCHACVLRKTHRNDSGILPSDPVSLMRVLFLPHVAEREAWCHMK